MTRVAYLDCMAGIAGDMLLGALIDAGGDESVVREMAASLGLENVAIDIEPTSRHGLAALAVRVRELRPGPARSWHAIRTLLTEAALEPSVLGRALGAFERLAQVEARIHGVSVEDVHFHEVGGDDALIDICGSAALVHSLGIERVVCSPLPIGRGMTRAAHGMLPLPAPAALALLEGAPVYGVPDHQELVTPTGAALASSLADAWGELPPLRLGAIGYGAGGRNDDTRPNLLRVILGESELTTTGHISVIETNLDDLSPQLVPDAVERCFEAGALDVWTAPVHMKKGRPGIVFAAMARTNCEQAVARAMLEHTTALGVRVRREARYELKRETITVHVRGFPVRVKLGRLDGTVVNVAPEHDDCAAAAAADGRSVKTVLIEAVAAAQSDPMGAP
jgi:uncharacterized protein (TIGR00299 family) protein